MNKYVQHISGTGEKWELITEHYPDKDGWLVELQGVRWVLPKSEYRLCEPPERWVDVTEQCMEGAQGVVTVFLKNEYRGLESARGYRLRKVRVISGDTGCHDKWAFIVEKRED